MKGDSSRQKKSKKTKHQQNSPSSSAQNQPKDEKPTEDQEAKQEKYPNEIIIPNVDENQDKSAEEKELDNTVTESANEDGSTKPNPHLRVKSNSESSSSSCKTNDLASNAEQSTNEEVVSVSAAENATENNTSSPISANTQQSEQESDYVNPRGVRFIQDGPNGVNAANIPYGLPCVRELLRFLISLINSKNSDNMISMGLNLITIGLESGIDHISSYQSLLAYVKDDLCKNLYNLVLTERLAIYASVLRVSFLLFESLRGHLKLQLEHFFTKLMEIIMSESNKIPQEQKEMTIDYFLQMLRIPGFAIEMYLNYDCSLNCSNLFEELTKLLSKVSLKTFILSLGPRFNIKKSKNLIKNNKLLKNNISKFLTF